VSCAHAFWRSIGSIGQSPRARSNEKVRLTRITWSNHAFKALGMP
jgi:hypothetical protein